jgi:hypothetical protein
MIQFLLLLLFFFAIVYNFFDFVYKPHDLTNKGRYLEARKIARVNLTKIFLEV